MIYNSKAELLAFWQATYIKMSQTPLFSDEHTILSEQLIDIASDNDFITSLPASYRELNAIGLPCCSDYPMQ